MDVSRTLFLSSRPTLSTSIWAAQITWEENGSYISLLMLLQCILIRSRNAAKTRTKDATTRTQKGFFGRQRLDILARGLASNQSRVQCARKDDIRPSIDLAHAKRDAPSKGSQNVPVTPQKRSYINKGTDSSGVATDYSDSGRQSSSSKVLTILDTTERMCKLF